MANHDGNVSVRLKGERFLITCTAVSKRDIDDASLLVVDAQGKVLEGRRKPFGELELHLAVYRARPEAMVVLHAHPPVATAFGLVGQELSPIALPEMVVSLGDRVPTLPRAMPRDPEGVKRVEAAAAEYDAFLLTRQRRHHAGRGPHPGAAADGARRALREDPDGRALAGDGAAAGSGGGAEAARGAQEGGTWTASLAHR